MDLYGYNQNYSSGVFRAINVRLAPYWIQLGSDTRAWDTKMDASFVHPVGNSVAPRHYGVLACVYLGKPTS